MLTGRLIVVDARNNNNNEASASELYPIAIAYRCILFDICSFIAC